MLVAFSQAMGALLVSTSGSRENSVAGVIVFISAAGGGGLNAIETLSERRAGEAVVLSLKLLKPKESIDHDDDEVEWLVEMLVMPTPVACLPVLETMSGLRPPSSLG